MTQEDAINIRSIQHFLYCQHRWGLLEIDHAWAENGFVVKANLLHSRVHDSDRSYASKAKKVFTAVAVYNDDYGLYGITDCIEAKKASGGADIDGESCALTIVEYKPTLPKDKEFNEDDAMQVFAQKICVDKTFSTCCNGVIYYADAKKRVPLPFDEQYERYDAALQETLSAMRGYLRSGTIPPIEKGQRCSGCSMKDLCMPSKKQRGTVRSRIEGMLEEDE